MWLLFAFLSAVFGALVAILGKIGLQNIDATLATMFRSIVMAFFMVLVVLTFGKFNGFSFSELHSKEWVFITLSGIAGALSWIFYLIALKDGNASSVVAIDKLSIILVVILAAIFLAEGFSWKSVLGGLLMTGGAILISLK